MLLGVLHALLEPVTASARIVSNCCRSGCALERKADELPVIAADRTDESAILAALTHAAPSNPAVAEEEMAESRSATAVGGRVLGTARGRDCDADHRSVADGKPGFSDPGFLTSRRYEPAPLRPFLRSA
jgi:3'-phosphoadenosine 5'-phosphosulfate (PAPS) 3'-phosphatase